MRRSCICSNVFSHSFSSVFTSTATLAQNVPRFGKQTPHTTKIFANNFSFRFYGIFDGLIWCINRNLPCFTHEKKPFIENMVLSYDMRIFNFIWNIKLVWGKKKYTPFTIHFQFVCDEFCGNVICRLASVCLLLNHGYHVFHPNTYTHCLFSHAYTRIKQPFK